MTEIQERAAATAEGATPASTEGEAPRWTGLTIAWWAFGVGLLLEVIARMFERVSLGFSLVLMFVGNALVVTSLCWILLRGVISSALRHWRRGAPPELWEYQVACIDETDWNGAEGAPSRLQDLGRRGWELVSTRRTEGGPSGPAFECVLKRRRGDPRRGVTPEGNPLRPPALPEE